MSVVDARRSGFSLTLAFIVIVNVGTGVHADDEYGAHPVPVPLAVPCQTTDDCADVNDDGIPDNHCIWYECIDDICHATPRVYGDVGGPNGACYLDGAADANDKFHALNCFSNVDLDLESPYPCSPINIDIGGPNHGCCPDGVCDVNDAFAALSNFGGPPGGCSCPNPTCTASVCAQPGTPNGTSCSDGNACTTADTCQNGACVGGPPLQCADGLFCNGVEICNTTLGCVAGNPPCGGPVMPACNEGGDVCVQCINNSHCPFPLTCNSATFTCTSVAGAAFNGAVRRGDGNLATGREIRIELRNGLTGLPLVPPIEITTTTGSYTFNIPLTALAFPFNARFHASSTQDVTFEAADINLTLQNFGGAIPDFIAFYTYHVDRPGDGVGSNGNDNASGIKTAPLANIQAAADRAKPGDRVAIHAGTYDSATLPQGGAEATCVLKVTTDGTVARPITIEASGSDLVVLDARNINRNAARVEANYITISKLAFANSKREGANIYASWRTCGSAQPPQGPPCFSGVHTGRQITGCRISECVAFNNSRDPTSYVPGIQIRGQVSDSIIENCASFQNGQGIGMEEESSVNTFRPYPLYFAPWPDAPRSCTIRGCLAFNNRKSDENSDGIAGRYLTDCTIENNVSFGNDDDAFDSIGTVNCLWAGNIAFNSNPDGTVNGDGNGIKVSTREGGGNMIRGNVSMLNPRAGFDDDDGTNNTYHNNLSFRNKYGFLVECDVGPNVFENNLARLNTADDVTVSQDCPNAPPFTPSPTNYNYWGDGRPPVDPCDDDQPFDDDDSLAFGSNGNGLTPVGEPRFVNSIDSLSELNLSAALNVQPGGVQAAVENIRNQVRAAFALQPTSPCINAGINVGQPFNGPAPDIGPYESP